MMMFVYILNVKVSLIKILVQGVLGLGNTNMRRYLVCVFFSHFIFSILFLSFFLNCVMFVY